MQHKPVTVTADMNIYDASRKILENKVSGVVVVDADNNLVGMLSELDCLRALITSVYNGADPGGALVSEIMTTEVEVNQPTDDIVTVATSMLDHKHRRRPIVVDGKLVGQLTCRQILGAIKDFN
ncbi:MAG: CBS domain-containing protein [SAR86 cluster bacterium]|uniref:CBS domain-containing protein n=1 Tax=SAR86 cluster bacterium TaxID=2030880 RepID=A0A973A983_9GAMM|nr:CBS domain-containing protein [SAR86 cluster bacterium]